MSSASLPRTASLGQPHELDKPPASSASAPKLSLKESVSSSVLNAQIKEPDVDSPFEDGSSKCGCFYWLTKKVPTNYDMLIFR